LPAAVVPVSALQGINVPSLLDEIVKLLPEGPATYPTDITTDQSERFLVAELIREKVLHATRAEVPHCTTVLVESLEEKERADGRRLLVVTATVAVEKESQKGILIGKGGGMLKRIGTEARRDIESMLEAACHLSLHVAVMPHWRDDRRVLGDVLAGGRGFSLPAGAAGQAAFRGDEDDAE
jgi:GTP-binding protein Era